RGFRSVFGFRSLRGRGKTRWPACLGLLLECIGELEERGLAPRSSDERQPDWKSLHETHRHGDVGIAGNGRWSSDRRRAPGVAVDQIDAPYRALCRGYQRIEAVAVERGVDTLRTRESHAAGARRP